MLKFGQRLFVAFMVFTFQNPLFAAAYFLSPLGNDSNPGSMEQPWLNMQNSATKLVAGDTLYIRGGVYRQATWLNESINGSPARPIVFAAIPNERPVFCNSKPFSNAEDWLDQGGNLWKTKSNAVTGYDVGCVWHDDLASEKKWGPENLLQQWDFYFDPIDKSVIVYSEENPASMAQNIEIPVGAQWQHIIQIYGASHLVFDGLSLKYSNTHGFSIGGNAHHITIRNCAVSHGGGAWIGDQVRYGNGIEVWESAHDILIEKNHISWIFDSALTNQGNSGSQINLTFRENTINNTKCGYEFWGKEELIVKNILVEKNRITDTGDNWADNLQNVWGAVRLMNAGSQTKNFVVRRNEILRCGSQSGGSVRQGDIDPFFNHPSIYTGHGPYRLEENKIIDSRAMGIYVEDGFYGQIVNNLVVGSEWAGLFVLASDASAAFYNNTIVNNGDFEQFPNAVILNQAGVWRNTIFYSDVSAPISVKAGDIDYNCYYPSSGPGVHSLQADPLFVDVQGNDFSLRAESPCIDRGVDVGIPFSGNAPDIGAFEFSSEASVADSRSGVVSRNVLLTSFPNPFNAATTIVYELPRDAAVTLAVCDLMGKQAASLLRNENEFAGRHQISFDGDALPSGLYFITLQAGSEVARQKVMLIK